ncbi:MAG: aminoglycoside phosphotransferase family protein [Kiritimatiellae bacterium]|nr:aminoglycoside phosphotransferase family protein [Kiritimatiellia bacterium]
MQTTSSVNLAAVAAEFDLRGDYLEGEPYGSGHINDTFRVRVTQAGTPVQYILQRLNTRIFRAPLDLMANVARVTAHAQARLRRQRQNDATRRALTLVPTRAGEALLRDADSGVWRAYLFIEQARTYDLTDTPAKAFEAARAFARFQALLADLPGERLHETIPRFHDTPHRYAALHEAVHANPHDRLREVGPELDFALSQEAEAGRLLNLASAGTIPERVTHNDTKINNVMIDDRSGEGVCVIDLDTVMPGLALYDFGDMVRSATINLPEDSTDFNQVRCRREIFEALARGYLEAADFLNATERAHLAFSGRLMTLECGVRFLTDYLLGDVYFKVRRPRHNLDRCRTQFALVRSIIEQENELQGFADGLRV